MDHLRIDPLDPDADVIEQATVRLARGELVAFPTETVYGLGADATRLDAVARIFAAKGRPASNPLISHVADAEAARRVVRGWTSEAEALARRFWPGPLTLVMPRGPSVADAVTAGLDTMAVRVPDHPVATALLTAFDRPVAAPSANPSTRVSPTTGEHVARGLRDAPVLLLDGGPTPVGIESTVVSLVGEPTLLRPGAISEPEIEAITGPLRIAPATTGPGDASPSPGMMSRHYAPRGRLGLLDSENAGAVRREVERARGRGRVTGALLRTAMDIPFTHVLPMPDSPAEYQRRLYASLHALDAAKVELAWVEVVPEDDAWAGVRDRLRRATTH